MDVISDQDKVGRDNRIKNKNARCIHCRKCYNTGLCMMHWPGFSVSGSKRNIHSGNDSPEDSKGF